MVLADSPNGTYFDFRPAYDRIADLENTYLEESVLAGIIDDANACGDTALGMIYVSDWRKLVEEINWHNC